MKGHRAGKEQNEHESMSFADHESLIIAALKNRYPPKPSNVGNKQSRQSSARNSIPSGTFPTGFSESGRLQIDSIHDQEISDTNTLDESKENSYHKMKIGIYHNKRNSNNFDYLYDVHTGNASTSNITINTNNSRNKGIGHARGKFTAEDEDEDSLDIGSVATTNTLGNVNSIIPYSEQEVLNTYSHHHRS